MNFRWFVLHAREVIFKQAETGCLEMLKGLRGYLQKNVRLFLVHFVPHLEYRLKEDHPEVAREM
jgi:hypothetical protein